MPIEAHDYDPEEGFDLSRSNQVVRGIAVRTRDSALEAKRLGRAEEFESMKNLLARLNRTLPAGMRVDLTPPAESGNPTPNDMGSMGCGPTPRTSTPNERYQAIRGIVYRTRQHAIRAEGEGDAEDARELNEIATGLNETLPENQRIDLSAVPARARVRHLTGETKGRRRIDDFSLLDADRERFADLKQFLQWIIELENDGGKEKLEEVAELRAIVGQFIVTLRSQHPNWFTESGEPIQGNP